MFYEYQNPHQMFRLVYWWTSGTLDSWLTSWLPTAALEKLVQGLGCQTGPSSAPLSPCLGSICFLRASCMPLSRVSARLPSVPHPVLTPRQRRLPLSLKPTPGRIISLCAGLPLVSKYSRPRQGARERGSHKSPWRSLRAWLLTA